MKSKRFVHCFISNQAEHANLLREMQNDGFVILEKQIYRRFTEFNFGKRNSHDLCSWSDFAKNVKKESLRTKRKTKTEKKSERKSSALLGHLSF